MEEYNLSDWHYYSWKGGKQMYPVWMHKDASSDEHLGTLYVIKMPRKYQIRKDNSEDSVKQDPIVRDDIKTLPEALALCRILIAAGVNYDDRD